MFQFIVANILMFSLGAILYLTARALPRIEEETEPPSKIDNFLHRLTTSEWPEKFDILFYGFLVKFLRRVKVSLLKLDNVITENLKKISKENGAKPKIDLNKINGAEETSEGNGGSNQLLS